MFFIKSAVFTLMMLFFAGCGKGNTHSLPPLQQGYVVDSPVAGLDYICGTIVGVTTDEGMFECRSFPVTFKIGSITIGSITYLSTDKKVYPQDIMGKERTDFSDSKVVELARFLQSLDDDGDIEQEIKITSQLKKSFGTTLTFLNLSEDRQKEIIENAGKTYVSKESAIAHLKDIMGKLTSIAITPATATISLGESITYTAEGFYNNGVTKDITAKSSWNSSAVSIATMNGSKAESKSLGHTTIGVAYKGVSKTAALTVTEASLISLQILNNADKIIEGDEVNLSVIGTFSDKTKANITSQVSWSSSEPSKATVNLTGKMKAISEGKVVITASLDGKSSTIELNILSVIADIRNEPYYKYAWHLAYNKNFGQNYGINKNANINIEEVWKITRGKGVTVAVIDASNFDWEHEDLKDNVINIYNSDEDNNKISNPGNSDEHSHGSTVSGFIASPVNKKGLVGVAPEAKLILIKQVDGSDSATIKGFEYAKTQGAKVINCSWGTNNVSQGVASELSELKNAGITIIFASGNEGKSLDDSSNDESELDSVIGVGSSNEYNDVTYYSNYGKNIDLIAPGGNLNHVGILGLDDSGQFGSSMQRSIVNNNYAFTSGTSFAAPITSGVAALMLSINPSLTPVQIRDILITTTDKVGNSATYVNGFDTKRAYGKLNAAKAVVQAMDLSLSRIMQ